MKKLVNLLEFLVIYKYLTIASYNRLKTHTVILCKCYGTISLFSTMLLWAYYEYVSTNVFKITIQKNS